MMHSPTTWEQCHAAGMTATQAARAMGKDARRAYEWANSVGATFARDPGRSVAKPVDLPPLPKLDPRSLRASDCQRLFINIATAALSDFRDRIGAARAGKTTLRMKSGDYSPILSLDAELREARYYLASYDFRLICEFAGVENEPEAAMTWVVGGIDTPSGITGRRYPTNAPRRPKEASQ